MSATASSSGGIVAMMKGQGRSTMSTPTTLEEVLNALREQEAALRQMQATLDKLLQASAAPRAGEGRGPMLAAVAVVDPTKAGFALSQRDLAEHLSLPPSYVSALVRAFKLDEDTDCAMVVRPGPKKLVNYHTRAVERFVELLDSPPEGLDTRAQRVVEQARHRRGETAKAA